MRVVVRPQLWDQGCSLVTRMNRYMRKAINSATSLEFFYSYTMFAICRNLINELVQGVVHQVLMNTIVTK